MVTALKHEPMCKLCRHPRRTEIDQLIELRANRTRDPETGKLAYTMPVVIEKLAEWGVDNPNEDNVKNHWRKHCEMIKDGAAAAHGVAVVANTDDMLAILDKSDGTVDGYLRSVIELNAGAIRAKILRGEAPGVTVDHALKAVAELTKRSHNEAQHNLMEALAGGIAHAIDGKKDPKQIPSGDYEIIDAEIEEVAA
jgi:hypothetical protein